ncbi:MAG: hypothetical protein ACK5F7_18215, partial [Planctomycetaceae bacterium]
MRRGSSSAPESASSRAEAIQSPPGGVLGGLGIASALLLALWGAEGLPRRIAQGSQHLASGWFWLLPL